MGFADKILNAVTGSHITTYNVDVNQLAAIINEAFIKDADAAYLAEVEKAIKGSKVLEKHLESLDGRFHLFVSCFQSGLTTHRTVWVKKYDTEDVWQWSGYTLKPLINAVQNYMIAAKLSKKIRGGYFMKNNNVIRKLAGAVMISAVLLSGCQINNVNDAVNNAMSYTNEKADAYRAACNIIREQLNAPSTAVFPSYEPSFVGGSDGNYEVSAYVEAENRLGGTSRMDWTATVKKVSDDKFSVTITSVNN